MHEAKVIALQEDIYKPTVIIRYLKLLLSAIDKTSQQKISKGIIDLNNTMN